MAAPQPEKSDQAPKGASTAPGAGTKPAGPPAGAGLKPVRRAGSLVSRLFFSIVLLLMLLGVAGYGALMLRDTDPRVGVAADYVDKGLSEAKGLIAGLTGEIAKPDAPRIARPSLEKAPLDAQEPAPSDVAREPEASTAAPAPEAPKPLEAEAVEPKPVEAKPEEVKPVEAPVEAKPVEAKPVEANPVEAKPVEAPQPIAVTPAPAPVAKADSRDADGFTDRDMINALEGRIDALGDEIRALREKLDAPKNETRAAPEAESAKPAARSDASAAAVVLAFALQRELDAGRPFGAEIAAFSRLATDPAPAPVLIEVSEKGAPTGPALREAFLPIAKNLRAQENHADTGALTEHLLQGASKLVKVRPAGEAQPETFDGRLDHILAALAHNDFDAAASAFDALPETARAEAGDFGARLRQRQEAARAADELLSGSIAALGKK